MMMLVALIVLWSVATGIAWIKMHSIVWWEWLVGVAIGFITVFGMMAAVEAGMTSDTETWSGRVIHAEYEPRWESVHQRAVYTTDSKGSSTFSHYETYYKNEGPHWRVETTLGTFHIDKHKYEDLKHKFGDEKKVRGHRPDYNSGPKHDFQTVNVNDFMQPITDTKHWENRVKAAPSVFSYPKIPEGEGFPYPENEDRFTSNRLIGRANLLNQLEFDRMNARLGPVKKVNVIAVGFPQDADSSLAQRLEAKWIGGKKNDLVLCFGGGTSAQKASWSYVFGWTEEELVKRNLETLLINNEINPDLLPKIEKEIKKNYIIKDWDKFDYLTVEIPLWGYFVTLVILIISQGVMFYFFHKNDIDEDNPMGKNKKTRFKWRR